MLVCWTVSKNALGPGRNGTCSKVLVLIWAFPKVHMADQCLALEPCCLTDVPV